MTCHAAVCVDDDLAPGQPTVPHGAADHEATGGIDEEVANELALLIQVRGQHWAQHMLEQVGLDERLRVDAVAVLGGDQDLLDLHGPSVPVADRDLRLAVGPQVGNHLGLAHLREPLGELVRQRDG